MSVNLLAVALAAVSSMVVGTVWFLPAVFGRQWMALTGVDPNKPRRPAMVYTLSFVAAVIMATALSLLASATVTALGGSTLVVTLAVASLAWIAFTAATTAVHYLFEGRHFGIYAINMGHQLTTLLIMAVIIGLFGF